MIACVSKHSVPLFAMAALVLSMCSGCATTRCKHRHFADAEAHALIEEKSCGLPWQTRQQFSVYPDVSSRWWQSGPADCPSLPDAAPQLYAYQLPLAPDDDQFAEGNQDEEAESTQQDDTDEPVIAAIPPSAWFDIPSACRDRMFDFESLRKEVQITNKQYDSEIQFESTEEIPLLDLREIIDLALLNSRDYLSQKEALYNTALQLSLERYEYLLFPTPFGNGTTGTYSHNRDGGTTVNNLSFDSNLAFRKALVTGGDILARFANNILLTFDGPQGFATDVSSELLFDFTQPLLQIDIQFESLTRAERNLVYAARDFARFRKQFFVNFAGDYYSLIRAYRQIEIDSQNYFSLVRAFNQAEAEFRAGLVPRVQVDQVEQNLLSGRGSLIGTCNGVEQELDSLKLAMGIPVESPINIDLSELDELTLNDELAVAADLIDRVQRRLSQTLQQSQPDRIELLSTGVVLIDRLLEASRVRQSLDLQPLEISRLSEVRSRLLVETARVSAEEIEVSLQSELDSESPSLPVIFQRTLALADAQLQLLDRQFELLEITGNQPSTLESIREQYSAGLNRTSALADRLQQMIEQEQMQQLPELVQGAETLRNQTRTLVQQVDRILNLSDANETPDTKLANTVNQINDLLTQSRQILDSIGTGLQPIDIDIDDAMVTALLLRFDLMNQREMLADDWRQIKLAADDLRSILDLNATQRIRTDPDSDDPFGFTWDESRTTLQLRFDAPLNRLAQRNGYRSALIDYQAAIRDLGGLEDSIKFSVRNDLRNLALDREQYLIAVASAALAFERVVSTSLEFRLGTGGVSARDFLEAQTAYIDALSAVASRRISYIVDRTQLFLDLELLTVNEQGFWEELYIPEYEPTVYFDFPSWASPVYGCLPPVCYSDCIKCPMSAPPGLPTIHRLISVEDASTTTIDQNLLTEEYFEQPDFETDECELDSEFQQ